MKTPQSEGLFHNFPFLLNSFPAQCRMPTTYNLGSNLHRMHPHFPQFSAETVPTHTNYCMHLIWNLRRLNYYHRNRSTSPSGDTNTAATAARAAGRWRWRRNTHTRKIARAAALERGAAEARCATRRWIATSLRYAITFNWKGLTTACSPTLFWTPWDPLITSIASYSPGVLTFGMSSLLNWYFDVLEYCYTISVFYKLLWDVRQLFISGLDWSDNHFCFTISCCFCELCLSLVIFSKKQ